jgi:thiol-disulfide isomerase/thioredoxin
MKTTWAYVMVAAGFAGLGSLVACQKQPDPAKPVVPAPAPAATAAAAAPAIPVAQAAPGDPVAALLGHSMNDAAGKPQALAQWKGKPLLVNFWAPWCGPCVREMPELSALAGELKARNINVVGIGIDTPTNIAEFTGKYKIAYPIYIGGMEATDLSRQLGNPTGGLPYSVLIGADGKILKSYQGILKFDELRRDLAAI